MTIGLPNNLRTWMKYPAVWKQREAWNQTYSALLIMQWPNMIQIMLSGNGNISAGRRIVLLFLATNLGEIDKSFRPKLRI
jgi:hypothetical protein